MRLMEMEEEVIDLSELLRLLWSHVLQTWRWALWRR